MARCPVKPETPHGALVFARDGVTVGDRTSIEHIFPSHDLDLDREGRAIAVDLHVVDVGRAQRAGGESDAIVVQDERRGLLTHWSANDQVPFANDAHSFHLRTKEDDVQDWGQTPLLNTARRGSGT